MSGFNVLGFSWITSPAATELEVIVLDWFAKILKLPADFLSSGMNNRWVLSVLWICFHFISDFSSFLFINF